MERLAQQIPDPSQYIAFFSLRKYSRLGLEYVTEQVYIHSKLMIVDDQIALIGTVCRALDPIRSAAKEKTESLHIDLTYTQDQQT